VEELEDLVLLPGAATPYLGLLAAGLLGMAGRYEFALLLVLFFGVRLAWPRAFALELDPLGFSYRAFLHRHRFSWRSVRGFRVRRFGLGRLVVFRSVVFEIEDGGSTPFLRGPGSVPSGSPPFETSTGPPRSGSTPA
jgi:hypothetical protein